MIFKYALTLASVGLAIVGLAVGLVAAGYWYKSSQIEPEPGLEPAELEQANAAWIGAVLDAFRKSAELNKKASKWTAFAVILSGLSAVLGTLAGCCG